MLLQLGQPHWKHGGHLCHKSGECHMKAKATQESKVKSRKAFLRPFQPALKPAPISFVKNQFSKGHFTRNQLTKD